VDTIIKKITDPCRAPTPSIEHKTKSIGLGFKLKSFFRSKEFLAAEMRKTLCDVNSQLLAFAIKEGGHRLIPHSVFHTLEATHMRTIISQVSHVLETNYFDGFIVNLLFLINI
jgi:hypothetical protein